MPNFFKEINSKEEYEEWLEPLYSPNIIFASREEEIPEVLIRLGVHFFLKFEFGFVSDLTETVINELNITSYPALLVLKYNFAKGLHEVYPF